MKWLLCGIFALTLLVVIGSLGNFGDDKAIPTQEPGLSAVTMRDSEQELRTENLKLREQIIQLNKEIAQLKHATIANRSALPAGAVSQSSEAPVEQENVQAKLQEFDNFLANGDSISVLKTSFDKEAVDSSWANIHQQKLEDFFKKSFTDVFPQYIECRSKRCKITVPVSDQKQFSELSQTLIQNTLNNKNGIAKKIVIEPTENNGTLSFYLARNEEISFLQ